MTNLYDGNLHQDGISIYRKPKLLEHIRSTPTGDAKLLVSQVRNTMISQQSSDFTCAVFCETTEQEPHCHDRALEIYIVLEGKLRVAWVDKDSTEVKDAILEAGDSIILRQFCCHTIGVVENNEFLAFTVKVPPDRVAKSENYKAQITCGDECGHSQMVYQHLVDRVS